MGDYPKRRKSKDNPYILNYSENPYIVTFKDAKGNMQNVKVNKEVHCAFDKLNLIKEYFDKGYYLTAEGCLSIVK